MRCSYFVVGILLVLELLESPPGASDKGGPTQPCSTNHSTGGLVVSPFAANPIKEASLCWLVKIVDPRVYSVVRSGTPLQQKPYRIDVWLQF